MDSDIVNNEFIISLNVQSIKTVKLFGDHVLINFQIKLDHNVWPWHTMLPISYTTWTQNSILETLD